MYGQQGPVLMRLAGLIEGCHGPAEAHLPGGFLRQVGLKHALYIMYLRSRRASYDPSGVGLELREWIRPFAI